MIKLSFSVPEPASPWRRTWEAAVQGDPAAIPEIDLRYKCFAVNVELVVNGVEIISKRRFVTLVDLALSLCAVSERISRGEDASFGFTESEDVIAVRRVGEMVSISSSKRQEQATTPSDELLSELSGFIQAAYSKLVGEIPRLAENPVIQRIEMGAGA
ncbi:hypothetical protein [Kitasatospora aureofaciens]|uniref:hypothetical protein n=1 Tax=Kitasatospora aureofaciens TaxID=1894 RepID=UPI0037CB842A